MTDAIRNIRAFLAIVPPEDVLEAMSRLQAKIIKEISGRISWTKPQAQHLTLKFFGDISAEDVNNISCAVQNRLASGSALNFKIGTLGVFPDARKPRVIWCGVGGDVEKLALLQFELDGDFAGLGFPQEDRPFRAHLTLGRIKDVHGLTGISEVLTRHIEYNAGEFACREIIMFQSKLTPQGAVYNKLAQYSFGA